MSEDNNLENKIAIVGRAGRFPGAQNVAQFWNLLKEGKTGTTQFSDHELLEEGVSRKTLSDPNYVKVANILKDMECFDAGFFGFSPKEASILDPQHRHFLECAWEALEDAGHMPENFDGRVGVFAGSGMQAYMPFNLLSNPDLVEDIGLFLLRHTGNDKDFLPTRLSYALNLQGPSVAVQTACSTSLVATHMALNSLLSMECDMAIAGGVSIELPHREGYTYSPNEILSPDGLCRAFDKDSDGTVFGSGAALVVLRRLEDAIEDGDDIKAVILASAINNDGSQKANYLAPSVEGQAEAVAEAVELAGIETETISYIEAHGTGTNLGDPIELTALNEIYGQSPKGSVGIGSVKTNIGHIDTAAGAASLIKVVEALNHKTLPESLNFKAPNPAFDFEKSPFFVVDKIQEWKSKGTPRRAAVNSLGVGGTNAHIIVEEAPTRKKTPTEDCWRIFPFSARTKTSLENTKDNWAGFFKEGNENLGDVAYTLRNGRRQFSERMGVAARTAEELESNLQNASSSYVTKGTAKEGQKPKIVFLFPGGGAQYPGACTDLLEEAPIFAKAVKKCFDFIPDNAPSDLYEVMFTKPELPDARQKMQQSAYAIPALFILEYAYTQLWKSFGIKPDSILAHSVGEYAGAVEAGVMQLKDAIKIVTLRGELMDAAPKGLMVTVPTDEAKTKEIIGDDLDIAALNAPGFSVVSGHRGAIEKLEAKLKDTEYESKRIHIEVAAHSRVLEGQMAPFKKGFSDVTLSDPKVPFVSSMRGGWGVEDDFKSADYWVRHLRSTVRFSQSVAEVLEEPNQIVLEVGPGQTLGPLVDLIETKEKPNAIVYSGRKPSDPANDMGVAMAALGALWANGIEVDWDALPGSTGQRISLPTYAFEKQHHWIEPGKPSVAKAKEDDAVNITRTPEISDWLSSFSWVNDPIPTAQTYSGTWLVFAGDDPLSDLVVEKLSALNKKSVFVKAGNEYSKDGQTHTIRPSSAEDYETLLESFGEIPERILHLWPLTASDQSTVFDSAFNLLRTLQTSEIQEKTRIIFATHSLTKTSSEESLNPSTATLLGPVRVAPREIPGLSARLIDLEKSAKPESVFRSFLDEFDAGEVNDFVAYRNGDRLVEKRSKHKDETQTDPAHRLVENGTYVITGGMGGIGQELATYLATSVSANVAILSRSASSSEALDQRIAKTKGKLSYVQCDVTDAKSVEAAIESIRSEFGEINGVFHGAGLIDDAPLSVKTLNKAKEIIAPKVDGAINLSQALPDGTIDFFAVFSSSSVVLGTPGQTDYVAANAFLESFVNTRKDGLSIAWGIWGDVGMAADAYGIDTSKPNEHPLLGYREDAENGDVSFSIGVDPKQEWVLFEHKVEDQSILPGVAYFDLSVAAAKAVIGKKPFEIQNMSITAPMSFPNDTAVQLIVQLKRTNEGYDISFETQTSPNAQAVEHAHGKIVLPRKENTNIDQSAVLLNANFEVTSRTKDAAQSGGIDFGPRWNNLIEAKSGNNIVEGVFELPSEFVGDIAAFPAHPALMDNAMTVGLYLLPDCLSGENVYAPISANSVRIFAPVPQKVVARATKVSGNVDKFASFDVVILDESGKLLIAIDGLAMRAIDGKMSNPTVSSEQNLTNILLANGINAEDAPEVFLRSLNSKEKRILVSSIPLDTVRVAMAPSPKKKRVRKSSEKSNAKRGSSVEAWLADVWSDLLGLADAEAQDNFFDLGGHSLNAVRMFSQVRKKYDVDLPLATLFEYPTLEELSGLIAKKAGVVDDPSSQTTSEVEIDEWSPLVRIKKGAKTSLPLYCVHGAGGNILNFRSLSGYLKEDVTFYGLRALGSDGGLEVDETVEAMATRYVQAIREKQPNGPYRLAGYSGGGVIAIEMANQLVSEGEEIDKIFLFDTLVPEVSDSSTSFLQKLWAIRKWDLKFALGWFERKRAARQGSSDADEIKRILDAGDRLPDHLVGQRISSEYMKAESLYKPREYSGDVILFKASQASTVFLSAGPYLGWDRHINGNIEVHTFECDHFSMMLDPTISDICDVLNNSL